METIEAGFDSVNKFIRPAVEQIQTVRGEQEFLGLPADEAGPRYELAPTGEGLAGAAPSGDALPGVGSGSAATANGTKATGPRVRGKARAAVAAREGGPPPIPEEVKNGIFAGESGGDYNALFGFSNRSGGKFENVKLTEMTVDQALEFAAPSGEYGQTVKGQIGRVATPMGAYQIVGTTLRAAKKGLGLIGNEIMDIELQDRLGAWILAAQGTGAWEGYKGPRDSYTPATGGVAGIGGGTNEYDLRAVNGKTFEPRLPFTVRDAAFNATADRVIGARAAEAMETGLMLAQQKANGDLGVLRTEMEKVRNEVMSTLPKELPGLATDLEATFTRGMGAAERQTLELKQRQKIAQTNEAMTAQAGNVKAEVERLALTGAGSAAISAALAAGQDSLAAYGPREGFVLNGKTYAPDPTRAGIMTPGEIATGIGALSSDASRIMIEAEFMKSAAPGQFVEEFRKQVFAGESPLGVGESLALLSELQGKANSAESARRTAANAERERLTKEYKDRINPYVEMTENGVPVAIPPQERQRILAALAPYPDLQREAETEFAVADAAVATHGMRGGEIVAYADTVKADLAAAAESGQIDLNAVAVLESLQDRIKKAQDAVTAEMIGLPMVEQLALDGATADEINWDALREQAAGNQEVLDQIAATEAFYRDVESLEGMTADERDAVLAEARSRQAELAAQGSGYGSAALQTQKVLDKLTAWSEKRADLAANDSMAFARSAGVAMPSMEGAQSMADVGGVLAERVALLAPLTASEGVLYPVPLEPAEIAALSEVYKTSTRADQTAFLAGISSLGQEQAEAIFGKIGQSEPLLFAAGTVFAGGNTQAAGVILRGSVDTKLPGGSADEISAARETVMGDMLKQDMIDGGSIAAIDAAAAAYARGVALSEGGRAMTQDDFQRGYEVAMGAQEDGTGGVQFTRYGTTVLPAGWDSYKLDVIFGGMNDDQLKLFAGGTVQDSSGNIFTADQLRNTMEQLRVDPENPNVLIPLDESGGVFLVDQSGTKQILTFDLGKM